MSMATGAGMNRMTPSLQRGKSKGGLTPFSMQQFTPEQMQLFGSMFGHLQPGGFLSKLAGGDESMFNQLEAPAMRQFSELQGNLASRFSGMGSGARHSSGFQNTMNQASSNFAQDLQSQRLGLQRQSLLDLMNMSNVLLQQNPYENFLMQKQHRPSSLQKALGIGLPIAGAAVGALGGPMGMAMGSQIGGSLGNAFMGQQSSPSYSGIGSLPTRWGS